MLKLSRAVFLVSTFAAISLAATGCKKGMTPGSGSETGGGQAAAAGEMVVIGEVGSMTGSQATFGTSTHSGIEFAIDQINAGGGIAGHKLKLVSLDDQGKPEEAATAVTKLITQSHASAIIGEVASSNSLAMAPIAQQYHVPMVSPSSTNPKVTEQGDFIFRVCFIDPFQGTVMAKFALDQLKVKKVAILRDVKSDYSIGLADYFADTFKKGGGEITVDQSYSAGDIDFKAQLTAIRGKTPDAIFVPGYYTEVGLVARQARDLGLNIPLLGGDGWGSPKLTEIGGTAMNNAYYSDHYSSEDKSPVVQDFITKFKAAKGIVPDSLAAQGYDAMMVVADAMKRSKQMATQDIRDALAGTKDFPGVTGKITIDDHRNPVKSAVIIKIADGGFKYQMTINP
jgi:branched-chain amino acid transport system substrate-binding protein